MTFPSRFVDLQDEVIAIVRLDATTDRQRVKDYLNQIYSDLVVEDEASVISGTGTLTEGSGTYALPVEVLRIKEITVSGDSGTGYGAPLQEVSLDTILTKRAGGGDGSTGTPGVYHLSGYHQLELYPAASSSTQVIKVDYVALPTALADDVDTPFLQEPYASEAMLAGGIWKGFRFLFGIADPTTQNAKTEYEAMKTRYRIHLNRRGGSRTEQMAVIGVGGYPPHDNSADVPWNDW